MTRELTKREVRAIGDYKYFDKHVHKIIYNGMFIAIIISVVIALIMFIVGALPIKIQPTEFNIAHSGKLTTLIENGDRVYYLDNEQIYPNKNKVNEFDKYTLLIIATPFILYGLIFMVYIFII